MSRKISMRFAMPVCLGITVAVTSFLSSCKSGSGSATSAPGPQITCADAVNPPGPDLARVPTIIDSSCSTIPFSPGNNLQVNGQQMADVYGWLSFVALNWPANDATCTADSSKSILTDPTHPTWLTYLTDGDVYVPSGPPAAWCGGSSENHGVKARLLASQSHYPKAVQKLLAENPDVSLVLSHNSKGGEMISTLHLLGATAKRPLQGILQATGQPLVDQNGRFVRYSISMNENEYNYVAQNKLYTAAGQKATNPINFPMGSSPSAVGAIEVKAAWKVLGANDDPSRFFTQKAIVFNNEYGAPSPGPNPVTVGLVGLHIAHKAWKQNTWTWSTFEQIDNDTKSFYNPNCNCAPNTPTAKADSNELSPQGKPLNAPVQVVPYMKPTNPTLNTAFQGLLKGTPWQYYEQVGTQWSNGAIGPAPQQIGNSVQETFVAYTKDGQPNPMYSCIHCHSYATAYPGGQSSDMSFLVTATWLQAKKH